MSASAAQRPADLRNYVVVTGAYWADTLTDGAIRLLVLFYFFERGYSPIAVASLFLFYEFFGIVTNLVGGWLATRMGLRFTLLGGLGTQLVALAMLLVAPEPLLVVAYVMVAQALSGIAKDLTKMSSKSAIKLVVPQDASGQLYRWVALLTGSKNAIKGVGFFLGGLLLTTVGFHAALGVLMAIVATALVLVLVLMRGDLGRPDRKAKFRGMFSNNRSVNVLASARIFLFASRDVWFVVGVPVFLRAEQGWSFWQVGTFLAVWVIGYGFVQATAPRYIRDPDGHTATWLAFALAAFPAGVAIALAAGVDGSVAVVTGLIAFGLVFALNSAVHSYLILAYAEGDKVAMNVGFYYMANAAGRLTGTALSGVLYQWQGLEACLWCSAVFVLATGLLSRSLPSTRRLPSGGDAGRRRPAHRRLRARVGPYSSSGIAALPSANSSRAANASSGKSLNTPSTPSVANILVGDGSLVDLPRTLPAPERYTYVCEGNSQVLDHILISRALADGAGRRYEYDIVHTNSEFADQASDHDPQIVRMKLTG